MGRGTWQATFTKSHKKSDTTQQLTLLLLYFPSVYLTQEIVTPL